ncbi:hypothetical protein [Allorhodopirellula heiligendammensis]|uniref:Uncharacterized protein n=1 Tax=Allorhodopirellula heiligendammensis TaxID=2714739 RepID=A0A5C6BZW6_9BACT|nr:hypothetical protein [Allorhodopirellula heiligendammensis]TWU16796.1 hypothetical protein Poly21_40030 [Allorhodopirellula heiligendammensis]
MAEKRVLVQWIGHSDLRALAAASSASRAKKILEAIRSGPSEPDDLGPTKTLLSQQNFDEVRLLTNYNTETNKWFAAWAGHRDNTPFVALRLVDADRLVHLGLAPEAVAYRRD